MITTGTLRKMFDTKQVSERFSKREFVVEVADNPKYPQLVMFEATGDRCAQLDGLSVGDEIRIEFGLRGREWKSPAGDVKYFNSLDAYKVEVTSRAAQGSSMPTEGIPFANCDLAHEPSPIARVLR